MENLETTTWDQDRGLLRYEPTHEFGVGRYYKLPGSGSDEKGYFAFIKAVYNQRFYEEEVDHTSDEQTISIRCDSGAPKNTPMPTALHEEDEETGLCKHCGSDEPIYGTTNSHYASLSNATILRMPFHTTKGFICYLELRDDVAEEAEVYTNNNMARTLQELFKSMVEWEWCYLNLDSEDIHAKLAYEMLQEMELPDSIRDWLWAELPDMHLAKFLKGDESARTRPDSSLIPDMHTDFESWCWYQIVKKEQLWKYNTK
jgi:hypothetical protein